MTNMARGWLIVCGACLILHLGTALDLYVSHNGRDSDACGPATDACKTLPYTVQKSSKNDVINLLSDSTPYYVQSVTGEPINITHTLYIRCTTLSVKLTCQNASTLFRVFKPEHEENGTSTGNVTLNLQNVEIVNCGGEHDDIAKGVIEVVNASVNAKNCKFSSNPMVIHHSQLAQDSCDYIKIVISSSHFTANGVIKPLQAAINIAGCNSVSAVIQNTTFQWSPISFKADQNLNVDISNCEIDGKTLRAGSLDLTLASMENHVVLTDCVFMNHNHSRGSTVTININEAAKSDPVVHLNRVTFRNNDQARTIGAALSLISRLSKEIVSLNAKISDCQFVNNTAIEQGGAVYIQGVQKVNMNDCVFSNNQALEGGALVIIRSEDILIQNCTFTGNKATQLSEGSLGQGGAILGFKSAILVDKTRFESNTAPIYGQAIHLMEATMATIQYTNFTNSLNIWENTSVPKVEVYMGQSEAVYASQPVLVMKDSKIQLAQCQDHTGVVHLESRGGLEYDQNTVCCPPGQQLMQLAQETGPLCSSDHATTLQQAWCSACPPGSYSPVERCESVGAGRHVRTGIKCLDCPTHASCPGSGVLRPISNYWGRGQGGEVSFYLCPQGYCQRDDCTGLECCSNGRAGRLCGKCRNDTLLDISTDHCLLEEDCKYHESFLYGYAVAFSAIYVCILLVAALACECIDNRKENIQAAEIPGQEQPAQIPPDDASDTSSFEPSLNYIGSVDSHGLVAVANDATQTSQGLSMSSSKAAKSSPCNLSQEAPFVICGWIMLIQLTEPMYLPWYDTSDQRHTIVGAMHDVINLRPLFVLLDRPCGQSSLASLSRPVLYMVSVCCMYATAAILHGILHTVIAILEKARGVDVSEQRKFLNASICRAVLLLFSLTYVPTLKSLFSLIHCVGNVSSTGLVLFLNAELSCRLWWHWLAVVGLSMTFAPVGVAIWMGLQLVKSDNIRAPVFLLGIVLPLPMVVYWEVRYGKHVCRCLLPYEYLYARMQLQSVELIPDTSHTELTITKFFNWPSSKLPLKSSTIPNPRPSGEDGTSAWIIYICMRAFIVVTFAVLLSHDPVTKSIVLVACLLLAMTLQAIIRPHNVPTANHVEWAFLAILLLLSVIGLHNSVLYATGWKPYADLMHVAEAFDWMYVALFGLSLVMLCSIVLVNSLKSCCHRS